MSAIEPRRDRPAPTHTGPDRWIPAVVAFVLLIALAGATASGGTLGHTPILWFLLLTIVCVRRRHEGWVVPLYLPALTLFVLWFAGAARSITIPFGIALLLAYLLDPVVDRMESRLGRPASIGLLAIPLGLGLAAVLIVLVPALAAEAGQLIGRLPELQGPLERLGAWAATQGARLGFEIQPATVADWILPRLEGIGRNLLGAGVGVWKGVQGVIAFIGFLVITPVVGYYLLRDFDRLRDGLLTNLPRDVRGEVQTYLERIDRAVAGYLRGQLLVGAISGTLFGVGLAVLGMDYAILVGISAIFLNLVPYVGALITALLAIAVALLSDPSWISLAKVGALYALVSGVEQVVSPRIMGESLSLHPVLVMLSVLIAGQFFGVIGLLIAVPAAAVLKESLVVWWPQLLELLPVRRDGPSAETES